MAAGHVVQKIVKVIFLLLLEENLVIAASWQMPDLILKGSTLRQIGAGGRAAPRSIAARGGAATAAAAELARLGLLAAGLCGHPSTCH